MREEVGFIHLLYWLVKDLNNGSWLTGMNNFSTVFLLLLVAHIVVSVSLDDMHTNLSVGISYSLMMTNSV